MDSNSVLRPYPHFIPNQLSANAPRLLVKVEAYKHLHHELQEAHHSRSYPSQLFVLSNSRLNVQLGFDNPDIFQLAAFVYGEGSALLLHKPLTTLFSQVTAPVGTVAFIQTTATEGVAEVLAKDLAPLTHVRDLETGNVSYPSHARPPTVFPVLHNIAHMGIPELNE
ncbi:hypothetical protein FISHEDRAFT_74563 [Fistulina hepatica ATCC 64428]|uniref:Uncharacterized protein n=1 Tax=Fistulina hepatica ATCC 64428 TaxID=1128425 RepID=A0A0D7A8X8_9AGAR|nr:hypothetical protein FISHEDRAFT_74563 [Fistulina hepatica ATCC 64428]